MATRTFLVDIMALDALISASDRNNTDINTTILKILGHHLDDDPQRRHQLLSNFRAFPVRTLAKLAEADAAGVRDKLSAWARSKRKPESDGAA